MTYIQYGVLSIDKFNKTDITLYMLNIKSLTILLLTVATTLVTAQTTLKKSAPVADGKYMRLSGTDILIPTEEEYSILSEPSNIKLMESGINITFLQNDDGLAVQRLSNYQEGLTFLDTTVIDYGSYTANVYNTEVKGFNKAIDIWYVSRGPYGYICAFEYERDQGNGKLVQEYIDGMVLDHSANIPYAEHLPFDINIKEGFEFAHFRFMGMHTIVSKGGLPMDTNTIMFSSVTKVTPEDINEFDTMASIDPENTDVQRNGQKQVLIKSEEPLKTGVSNRSFIIIDNNQAYKGNIIAHDANKVNAMLEIVNSITEK